VISLKRVEQIGYDHFDAVYIPGGHAPMQDLLVSRDLGRCSRISIAGERSALVCHGPIALMSTLDDPARFTAQLEAGGKPRAGDWICRLQFHGNQQSGRGAGQAALGGGEMKFYPQTALEQVGGVSAATPNRGLRMSL
jgi:putative intracellular protease/amidase